MVLHAIWNFLFGDGAVSPEKSKESRAKLDEDNEEGLDSTRAALVTPEPQKEPPTTPTPEQSTKATPTETPASRADSFKKTIDGEEQRAKRQRRLEQDRKGQRQAELQSRRVAAEEPATQNDTSNADQSAVPAAAESKWPTPAAAEPTAAETYEAAEQPRTPYRPQGRSAEHTIFGSDPLVKTPIVQPPPPEVRYNEPDYLMRSPMAGFGVLNTHGPDIKSSPEKSTPQTTSQKPEEKDESTKGDGDDNEFWSSADGFFDMDKIEADVDKKMADEVPGIANKSQRLA